MHRLVIIATLCLAAPLFAADGPNFADDVLPIMRTHCVNCHRPGKTRAGLDLTTVETIEKGGSSGASVQPGLAENSILYRAMAHIGDEEPMPPEKDKLRRDGGCGIEARAGAWGFGRDAPPCGVPQGLAFILGPPSDLSGGWIEGSLACAKPLPVALDLLRTQSGTPPLHVCRRREGARRALNSWRQTNFQT